MKKLIIATALALSALSALLAMPAFAACKTYVINGEHVVCCTVGSVTTCESN